MQRSRHAGGQIVCPNSAMSRYHVRPRLVRRRHATAVVRLLQTKQI